MSDPEIIPTITAQIVGYRQLTGDEQSLINEAKVFENNLAALADRMARVGADPRNIAMAKTHFQDGFMRMVRAIAKPNSAWGEFL